MLRRRHLAAGSYCHLVIHMRHMIHIIITLLTVYSLQPTTNSLAVAETKNATISWDIDPSWSQDSDDTWINADIRGVTKPRRLAIYIYNHQTEILRLWDYPGNRTVNVSFDFSPPLGNRITLHPVAYEGQPWQPASAYAVGDMLAVGIPLVVDSTVINRGFPAQAYWWECSRAGTTGATEPDWQNSRALLLDSYRYMVDGKRLYLQGAAVDNGGGTVNLPVLSTLIEGDIVSITGTTNYNGQYTLPAQTNGDADNVEITATYIAETFAPPDEIHLTAAEAVDNGDGTITLPIPGHGFVEALDITLSGTPWAGAHTLPAQTNGDADHLVITGTYEAYTTDRYSYGYPTAGTVIDNGGGTVTLPAPGHGMVEGDVIDLVGLSNYAGPYTLPAQTNGDADNVEITASFVAEVIHSAIAYKRLQDPDAEGAEWRYTTARQAKALSAAAAVNLGSGLVSIPCPGHGMVEGDEIRFVGTTSYNNDYTLPAQTLGDAAHIVITATYVGETFATTDTAQLLDHTQRVLTGTGTKRLIIRDNGSGQVEPSGINFMVRYQ
jgi:hypothetical protein